MEGRCVGGWWGQGFWVHAGVPCGMSVRGFGKRDMPLFSSSGTVGPGESSYDSALGALVDAVISSQLASVRASLSASRAARFDKVCS